MKITRIAFLSLVSLLVLLAACGPAPAAAPEVVVVKETVVVEVPAASEPQAAAPAAPAQAEYAPLCPAAAPGGCEAPTVEMMDNKYCVDKIPYAIMAVPAGTTYESLDADMTCVDQMHSDGELRITCSSGRELWSYDLKLSNPACDAPDLVMGSPQCQAGYGFDVVNQCCAQPVAGGEVGGTVYQVDIGACPLPQ